MFAYISGKLAYKADNYIVIDVAGVGYKIFTPSHTMTRVEDGATVKMFTHMHVREDIFDVYGFLTNEELHTFHMLLSVSGVGTKVALAILSSLAPAKFALAVITGDAKSITIAQGVGAKVAQRIILELKDKIKTEDAISSKNDFEIHPQSGGAEAVDALMVLGYARSEAVSALSGAGEDLSLEESIKHALKKLMK